MAREGRFQSEPERPGAKSDTSDSPSERAPTDLEHTQPMERTEGVDTLTALDETTFLGAPLPRIEQLPQGIIVKEGVMGRATGQWIVQIRCECGRRWFDVQMVKTARCPRCEAMVVIEAID